jgi:phage-related protein
VLQRVNDGMGRFGDAIQVQSETDAAKFAEAQAKMAEASIKLGAAILPLITVVLPKLVDAVTWLVNAFTNLPTPIQDGILAFFGLLAILGPILLILGSLIKVVGTLSALFAEEGFVISTLIPMIAGLGAPLLLVIAAVALLAYEVHKHWHEIIDYTSDLMLAVSDTWNKGWKAVADFFTSIWTGIKTGIKDAVAFIQDLLNGLFSAVSSVTSKILAPIQSITGAVSSVGSMLAPGASSLLSMVPHFATGGIVTSPTYALVGEAGPEAIIPLSAFAGGASLSAAGGGGGGGISIYIQGGNYLDSNGATMIANAIGKQILQQLRLKNFN